MKPPSETRNVLVCTSITKPHVPGSQKHNCEVCKRGVWISPASFKLYEEYHCLVLCPICAVEAIQGDKNISVASPSLGQIREVMDALLPQGLDSEMMKDAAACVLKQSFDDARRKYNCNLQ